MRRKQQSAIAEASGSNVELETHVTLEEIVNDVCRLCSHQSNGSFGIFSEKGIKKNVSTLAKIYLNVEVGERFIIHNYVIYFLFIF